MIVFQCGLYVIILAAVAITRNIVLATISRGAVPYLWISGKRAEANRPASLVPCHNAVAIPQRVSRTFTQPILHIIINVSTVRRPLISLTTCKASYHVRLRSQWLHSHTRGACSSGTPLLATRVYELTSVVGSRESHHLRQKPNESKCPQAHAKAE